MVPVPFSICPWGDMGSGYQWHFRKRLWLLYANTVKSQQSNSSSSTVLIVTLREKRNGRKDMGSQYEIYKKFCLWEQEILNPNRVHPLESIPSWIIWMAICFPGTHYSGPTKPTRWVLILNTTRTKRSTGSPLCLRTLTCASSSSCTVSSPEELMRSSTRLCWKGCSWARSTNRQSHWPELFVEWRDQKERRFVLSLVRSPTTSDFSMYRSWPSVLSDSPRAPESACWRRAARSWRSTNLRWKHRLARTRCWCRVDEMHVRLVDIWVKHRVYHTALLNRMYDRREESSNELEDDVLAEPSRSKWLLRQ